MEGCGSEAVLDMLEIEGGGGAAFEGACDVGTFFDTSKVILDELGTETQASCKDDAELEFRVFLEDGASRVTLEELATLGAGTAAARSTLPFDFSDNFLTAVGLQISGRTCEEDEDSRESLDPKDGTSGAVFEVFAAGTRRSTLSDGGLDFSDDKMDVTLLGVSVGVLLAIDEVELEALAITGFDVVGMRWSFAYS